MSAVNPENPLIAEMRNAIVNAVKPLKIIVFGSYARGTQTTDSDLDFLIIEEDEFTSTRSRRKEMARIWRLLWRFPVAKDLLVYSRSEAEKLKDSPNHIVNRALREGQVIYDSQ